jgi:hypothetical protein
MIPDCGFSRSYWRDLIKDNAEAFRINVNLADELEVHSSVALRTAGKVFVG